MMKHGAKIELRLKSFTKLTELPNQEGKIVLKLVPDDFERARDAVMRMQKEMMEVEASLPPKYTPISSLFDDGDRDTQELK